MRPTESKSSALKARHEDQEAMRGLTLEQKLRQLNASNVLAELPAAERKTALKIIRQRDARGQLDGDWLAGFLEVLSVLAAEESRCGPGPVDS